MTKNAIDVPQGFELIAYDTIDSTNDEAKRLAEKGAHSGALIWARTQTSARGRRGRSWSSPKGNLCCSLLLRPDCAISEAAKLTFLVAVAMAEAIEDVSLGQVKPYCKWPNDLLVDGKKIAGILLETSSNKMYDTDYLVIGTGVNVAFHPENQEKAATSINSCCDSPVSLEALISAYLEHISSWMSIWQREGFPPIRQAWLQRVYGLGKPVVARLPNQEYTGIFVGLDPDGCLVLRDADKQDHLIGAGEVFFEF